METIQTKKVYLRAEAIYTFLTTDNEALDSLIIFKSEVQKTTTDQSLYEAIGAIEDKSAIRYPKLVKLLEVTEVTSFRTGMKKDRTILTHDRADEIKKKAGSLEGGIQNVR